ncbi:ATP-grasp domain-containing protein [Enterobacteriaceae bacterium BIT-l23]|uniref:ATP-grasp domain-containing protein n=1 Tax=Jejubacter sp. L23 TaxID=3092086 RepID=UPI001585CC72|nr:ATP-grasp domain-containing protein [Enterobacteriaceae bacterium BIT-l23]
MKKVAIVDGFSSGKFIAKALYDMNCQLIHISSSADLDSYYYNGFDYDIYTKHIIHEDLERTIQFISEFGAEVIIAGAECGVLLSDKLNAEFKLKYSNDYTKTTARRNKFDMIELLRCNDLNSTRQGKFSQWKNAEKWLKGELYPVVLKPIDSAGSDGVFVCNRYTEARAAFNLISKKINKLNNVNDEVLFQEFLYGTEYVVNFVSLDCKVLVTEVVKYHKKKLDTGNIVYDIDEIVDVSYSEFNELVNYTKKVCQCLGIKNGPSHAEIMLTKNGPRLVEIAARSDGILRPDVSLLTTGVGQSLATAISIVNPELFLSMTEKPCYKLINHSFNVGLINKSKGVFKALDFSRQLERLKSFHRVEFYVHENAVLEETRDVFSQPGTVYLISDSKEQLWEDYRAIRKLESAHVYNKKGS